MDTSELFLEFEAGFPKRKFSAGLLIAFIDFYLELQIPGLGIKSLEELLAVYPKLEQTQSGARANTLIVALPRGGTLSLRPFYNQIERFFRAENSRFDYPSCAPHATQCWSDYLHWLDALAGFQKSELFELRKQVINYVLSALKDQSFDPASARTEPALFRLLLEGFDMSARKEEPSGAAFQGIVFGFLRADNPHLQIEIDKVRTGSKRLQRVGDIDCWDGAQLAISCEVKHFDLRPDDIPYLEGFANAISVRGSLGLLVARSFKNESRKIVESLGLKALDADDLLRIVELWDPLKQRTAVSSFIYYARHVEKNSSLASRIDGYLSSKSSSKAPIENRSENEDQNSSESMEAKIESNSKSKEPINPGNPQAVQMNLF